MCMRNPRPCHRPSYPAVPKAGFTRLSGLYRRWEVEQILEAGKDLLVEEAGHTDDGTAVYFAFQRESVAPDEE